MAFGPDGYLYFSMGDGGLQGDPLGYAQNLGELLGKILRIDVDQQAGGLNYAIPPGNPFVGMPGAREEIWAYGLRNPYRMSIDQVTGDLWHGDVGERAWEEVNFQPGTSAGGENYGWNITEGTDCYSPPTGCNTAGIQFPIFEYEHVYVGPTVRCAVIGGLVYRGREMATLQGSYFFGDQCSNEVISLRQTAGVKNSLKVHFKLPDVSGQPCSNVSWGEDAAGELYAACHQTGCIYRIIPDGVRLRVPELAGGASALIQALGCTPNGTVYLAYSSVGLGMQSVPALGVTLDLKSPKLGSTTNANANGLASFPVAVPASFSGRRLWFQVAEQGAKSNVVEEVID
jgi:glucose/arabinose dehydrogenase